MTMTMTGVVIALVTDVNDPLGQDRVQVKLPWLSDDPHGWAPVASPMAGEDRGYHYPPEVGDEALVAFLHGDGNHPCILGYLHNGVDKPPVSGIDAHVRRVRSVAGHTIDLDDRSGGEKVQVRTNGGNQVDLRDFDGTIEITTNGGQQVTMRDSPASVTVATETGNTLTISDSPSQIEVKTVAGVSLTISDTGVTLDAATAPVTVRAPSATMTVSGPLQANAGLIQLTGSAINVNSAITTFSGVVTCSALVAGAVSSTVYSPGVGNLL